MTESILKMRPLISNNKISKLYSYRSIYELKTKKLKNRILFLPTVLGYNWLHNQISNNCLLYYLVLSA